MPGRAKSLQSIQGLFGAMEGIFAINKPAGISSAQALRDLQTHFNPSLHFKPWIEREIAQRRAESRSSHNKRSKAKRVVQVKLGHGGTLDPAATGVLICGTGKGTKALPQFLECTKTYEAIVLFGAATDSYDGQGKLVDSKPFEHVTRSLVEEALQNFRGKFMQKPPIFSALHVDGKRLYEYAREGKAVPGGIEARPVEVENIQLLEWMDGGMHDFRFPAEAPKEEKEIAQKLLEDVAHGGTRPPSHFTGDKRKRDEEESGHLNKQSKRARSDLASAGEECAPKPDEAGELEPRDKQRMPPAAKIAITSSRGFYVRSLCHDLGIAVGSLGFMAKLIRTRQGDFELGKNVFEYEDLAKGEDVWAPQIERMLNDWNAKSG